MTKPWSLFKALSWPRFIRMNWIVGFELLALVISGIWTAIQGDFHTYTPFFTFCGFGMIPIVIATIMLATNNERLMVAETYRLIPINEWKLYAINLAASLVNQVYLWIVQAVIFLLTLWLGRNSLNTIFEGVPAGLSQLNGEVNLVQLGLTAIVLGLLAVVLVWSTISLVHYVTNATASFLPRFRQGFINAVITVVVFIIAIRLISMLIGGVSYLSSQIISGGVISSMWTGALVMLIIIIVESALNVVILQKWVEPKGN
ncbi:ABC transporter permease [Lactiplantibacillus carotarum]|uniref:ABC transporter permease n=1 Tax=Lactiplantibacillus carotarum TaxID=2993456 RepID=UPI00298EF270|nr:ABC transporter permease [Lactiplantibacillus carotarum]